MKVIVGTGWWSDESKHDWALGASSTRDPSFFSLWYAQVICCLDPYRIIVTDSSSPQKPNLQDCKLVQWVELDQNYGHANDLRTGKIKTKYCGFTRSVLNGAMFALCCDADFYVYVEQDCLLFGREFLRHAMADSEADILLGQPAENAAGLGGKIATPMLQQSLMVIRRSGLERLICRLLEVPWTDGDISPESTMMQVLKPFDFLRVPFGRSRPIDFSRDHFYVQHLTEEELAEFSRL